MFKILLALNAIVACRNKHALNYKIDAAIQRQLNSSQDYSSINITFVTLEKASAFSRKRYEAQVKHSLNIDIDIYFYNGIECMYLV